MDEYSLSTMQEHATFDKPIPAHEAPRQGDALWAELPLKLQIRLKKQGQRLKQWSAYLEFEVRGNVLIQQESSVGHKVYSLAGAFAKSPHTRNEHRIEVSFATPQNGRQSLVLQAQTEADRRAFVDAVNQASFTLDPSTLTPMYTLGQGSWGKVMLTSQQTTAGKLVYAMKEVTLTPDTNLRHVLGERLILGTIAPHPRIMRLFFAARRPGYLYYGMEFLPGGDLYTLLSTRRKAFHEADALFYAAEVASALEYLHANNVIYRDLKPENVLLTYDGHVKLGDFGMARKLKPGQRTMTFCGTDAYIPPEMHMGLMYSSSVDFWQFGCFVFELTRGKSPFLYRDKTATREKTLTGTYEIPKQRSAEYNDLVAGLLKVDMHSRITSWETVKQHRWFQSVDWSDAENGLMTPPSPPLYARSAAPVRDASVAFEIGCEAVKQLDHVVQRSDTGSTATDDESISSLVSDVPSSLLVGWTASDIGLALRNFDSSSLSIPARLAGASARVHVSEVVFRQRLVGFEWIDPSIQHVMAYH